MKAFSVLIALFVLSLVATADDKVPAKLVRVTGVSEVKVVPDRAVLEVGVEKQNASASLAKGAADAAARRILTSLRQSGVDEKDIQTTYLSLQPQFDYRKGMKISYFVADQTMSITLRDLRQLDTVLDSLIKVGGNQINSIQYETSDLRKYRDQARDLAVKAAREKAEALAHALGQDIGKAYAIEEVPESTYGYSSYLSNVELAPAKTRAPSGPSTAIGQKTVSASIVVSFDLN
jgi:uncharacterized protein YggE